MSPASRKSAKTPERRTLRERRRRKSQGRQNNGSSRSVKGVVRGGILGKGRRKRSKKKKPLREKGYLHSKKKREQIKVTRTFSCRQGEQ